MPVKRLAVAVMAAFIADAVADAPAHSDEEIKAQFVFAGMCRHAEDIESNYDYAFRMADNDTNRYARVLSGLAQENTNQTRRVIRMLGLYKTNQSLPFLYSYATNAQYGADALKAVFAIEGVNSNSLAVVQSYLMLTNEAVCIDRGGGDCVRGTCQMCEARRSGCELPHECACRGQCVCDYPQSELLLVGPSPNTRRFVLSLLKASPSGVA